MSTLHKLTLLLVLLLTGLLAGLQMFMLMGLLPAMARMPLMTYAGMWQSLDYYMAARMPIFANSTLLFLLTAICLFARSGERWIFRALWVSFALLAADTIFTVGHQLPVNRAVQALDLAGMLDLAQVQALRDATISHFQVRAWLDMAAFVCLASAVVASPGKDPAHALKRR